MKLFDGQPDADTVQMVYDDLDFMRGVQTFLNGMLEASIERLWRGQVELGATDANHVVIFDDLMDSDPIFLTGNTDTVYALAFFDLKKDGPMVVEVPKGSGPGTVNDAFMPGRTHGTILSGTAGEWSTWAVGAFNNWIDSDESFSDTTTQFVGRVTWVPAVSQDESNLLHLGLGARYSDAKQPLRASTEPEFNNAPNFVDTGEILADDAVTYSLEAYWRKGPFLAGFEYLGTDVSSETSRDPFFSGYSITGSWAVTGETRAYHKRSGTFDPLPVARPVNQGGWGALEIATRYSTLDLTDGTVDGGDMDILSLGFNWWLTRSAQFGVNCRYISLDRDDIQGDSLGLNTRLLLMLD